MEKTARNQCELNISEKAKAKKKEKPKRIKVKCSWSIDHKKEKFQKPLKEARISHTGGANGASFQSQVNRKQVRLIKEEHKIQTYRTRTNRISVKNGIDRKRRRKQCNWKDLTVTRSPEEEHAEHPSTRHGACWQHCANTQLDAACLAWVKHVLYHFQLTACWEENKPRVISRTCLWSSLLTEPSKAAAFTRHELERQGQVHNQCPEQTCSCSLHHWGGKLYDFFLKKHTALSSHHPEGLLYGEEMVL